MHARAIIFQIRAGQRTSGAEPDNTGDVLGAGAPALFLPATVQQRREFHRLVHDQRAYAFRSVELVRRERHELHAARRKINLDLARRLHRVGVQHAAVCAHLRGQRGNILNHAGLVVGPHHGNQLRTLLQQRLCFRLDQPPLPVHRQHRQLPPTLLQHIGGRRHRGMFGRADGDASRSVQRGETLDGEIAGLGAATGEDHLLRLCVDQRGHLLARAVHRGARHASGAMHARRIAVMLREIGQHGLQHPRVQRRGRVMIEINRHGLTRSEALFQE